MTREEAEAVPSPPGPLTSPFRDDVAAPPRDEVKAAFVEALEAIRDLEPEPFQLPADWEEQIKACPECQRYKTHPVQQGICNTHRQPLWDRERHDLHEEKALGYRAKRIAREALDAEKEARG